MGSDTQSQGVLDMKEFEQAIWLAFETLMITHDEAVAVIEKYKAEKLKAPEVK